MCVVIHIWKIGLNEGVIRRLKVDHYWPVTHTNLIDQIYEENHDRYS